MATLRTITAPGVLITEIDKSMYSPAMTGTKSLVMGFANKGEDYKPMQFTSKTAWLNYYGEPDTEAEKYFYLASEEILNLNGTLYCSKLPYENAARDQYCSFKYNVGKSIQHLSSIGERLEAKDANSLNTLKSYLLQYQDYQKDLFTYTLNTTEINDNKSLKNLLKNNYKVYVEKYAEKLSVYTLRLSSETCVENGVVNIEDVAAKLSALVPASKQNLYTKISGEVMDAIAQIHEELIATNQVEISAYTVANLFANYDKLLINAVNLLGLNESNKDVTIYENSKKINDIHMAAATGDILKIADLAKEDLIFNKYESVIGECENSENWVNDPIPADDASGTVLFTSKIFDQIVAGEVTNADGTVDMTGLISLADFADAELSTIKNSDNTALTESTTLPAFFGFRFNMETVELNFIKSLGRQQFLNYDSIFEDILNSFNLPHEKFEEIRDIDSNIKDYVEISACKTPYLISLEDIDEYRTAEKMVGTNEIVIADISRGQLGKIPQDDRKGQELEMIGIVPVITTAANAMLAQALIDVNDDNVAEYESVNAIKTLKFGDDEVNSFRVSDCAMAFTTENHGENDRPSMMDTLSKSANDFFQTISLVDQNGITHFDTENLKKIGVVVFRAYLDPSVGNKINFEPVEAFCGSLGKNDKNPTTGASTFIDTIVNSQSQYINLFSNCFNATALKKQYENEIDILTIAPGTAPSLGFYEKMCVEDIDLTESIYRGIDLVSDKIADINEREIDIIVDAGMSNIAQYIQSVFGGSKGQYNPTSQDASVWKCEKSSDTKTWKAVLQKFDNICKNVRKDCMFVADGPRPLVLINNKKIVRDSKPKNTIDANILPYVKFASGLNTNYGAGYIDWFEVADEFSGQYIWCPPSIKATGVYIYTDTNFRYWDAPAGLNRGLISALDVSFSPTPKQAGVVYEKNWNYSINYPQDGIVLEGQKTFQTKPSAFDRVNVRRLFLRLERAAYKIARYFVYEANTAYTRTRLVDALDPYFKDAKVDGGIYDYKIICDESINTDTVIDNNELRVKIGIKPVKTAEFIMLDFICLRTGGSWSEM